MYGSDRRQRRWLELQEIPHVLAIKGNKKLWAWTEEGPRQMRADRLAPQVEESDWARLSAEDGAKDPGFTTGSGSRSGLCGNQARGTGCWSAAA